MNFHIHIALLFHIHTFLLNFLPVGVEWPLATWPGEDRDEGHKTVLQGDSCLGPQTGF